MLYEHQVSSDMENDTTPTFKRPNIDLARFQVAPQKTPEYEHYINLTSKLIGRPYIATAGLVAKWPIDKIIRHYELCTKHAGTMPGDVKWWWLRKKDSQP